MMNKPKRGVCTFCGNVLTDINKPCAFCNKSNKGLINNGILVCSNCNSKIKKDDKYCTVCGTKIGKGKYEPYLDYMRCVYGPMPVERLHRCTKCKYEFNTFLMVDNCKYCPKCGGILEVEENNLRDINDALKELRKETKK